MNENEKVVEEVQSEQIQIEENEALMNGNGEEILFPEGPTMKQVDEWKAKFKDIYFTEFEDEVFLWRCITRNEYKEISNIPGADTFYREERIVERVTLWPANYDGFVMRAGKAGIPSFLAEQILEKSGFAARAAAIKL